jgi:hypothetical protein
MSLEDSIGNVMITTLRHRTSQSQWQVAQRRLSSHFLAAISPAKFRLGGIFANFPSTPGV